MTPRQLQTIILAHPECQALIHTNEDPKVDARIDDQAIADILNGEGLAASTKEVEAWRAKRYLVKRLKWRSLLQAGIDHPIPAVKAAAQVAQDLSDDARMMADFADPVAQSMWNGLVAAGLIARGEADEIIGWSVVHSAVTGSDVSTALRGPWGDE